MNNNIQEDYCSFEVSKLLKEKGFDVWCKYHFELALTSKKDKQDGYSGSFGWKKGELNVQSDNNTNSSLSKYYNGKTWYACSRPTHALAIKWIRENFGIHIYTREFETLKFCSYALKNGEMEWGFRDGVDKPEEAVEAALLYTLKNLI